MRLHTIRKQFTQAIIIFLTSIGAPTFAESQAPLQLKVFMSSEEHMGLGVSSAIIYGERDAIVVDAQFTLSNAHRLVAEIIETGRDLKMIYITHVHPDHFLGLPVLKQAFPNARVVSLKVSADEVNSSFDFKLEYWGNKVLGKNGAKTRVTVEALDEPVMMLEGRRLEVLGPFQGDAANSSVIWIPSISTLVASDLIYDHAHAWLSAAKSPELRQKWLDALDILEALNPKVVVPGHAPTAAYLSPASINYTRQYIKTFIANMETTNSAAELQQVMNRIYPDIGMQFSLEYGSKILKDGWVWEGQWPESLRNMTPR
jgi:glyoxylase-like metal-dependent hydrolase (beta-lactamase superfamily II)